MGVVLVGSWSSHNSAAGTGDAGTCSLPQSGPRVGQAGLVRIRRGGDAVCIAKWAVYLGSCVSALRYFGALFAADLRVLSFHTRYILYSLCNL